MILLLHCCCCWPSCRYDYHTNWFHYIGKKTDFQNEFYPAWPFYMREWPAGWHGIDDE